MTTREDYIKQIDEQSKKPMDEQLDDLKGAGADCLVALDKLFDDIMKLSIFKEG